MNKFLTVFKFHLKESLHTKTFQMMSFSLFFLIIGFFAFTHFVSTDDKTEIKIYSDTSIYSIQNEDSHNLSEHLLLTAITKDEIESAKSDIKEGNLDGLVLVDTENNIPVLTYFYSQFPDNESLLNIRNQMHSLYLNQVTTNNKLDSSIADSLLAPIQINAENLNNVKSVGLVYVFSILMYLFIIMFGQMVALNVSGEKVSRVMEVMITKVKPITMMYAKVFSSLVTGLVQIAVVASAYMIVHLLGWTSADGIVVMNMPIDLSIITPKLLILFIVYFVLGFTLYALLFAALSSVINRLEDLNTVITPAMLLLVVAFYLAVKSMTDPNATIVVISSYIPFFSPVVTFSRVVLGEAGYLELSISICILLATIAFISRFANRLYTNGVMRYSSKIKMSDIFGMTKRK